MQHYGSRSWKNFWKKRRARKASQCAEVAKAGEMLPVRDSKDPSGPASTFSRAEWEAFLVGVRAGQSKNSSRRAEWIKYGLLFFMEGVRLVIDTIK